jgi:hypothetical protein
MKININNDKKTDTDTNDDILLEKKKILRPDYKEKAKGNSRAIRRS